MQIRPTPTGYSTSREIEDWTMDTGRIREIQPGLDTALHASARFSLVPVDWTQPGLDTARVLETCTTAVYAVYDYKAALSAFGGRSTET
jgi:hypothetical protein